MRKSITIIGALLFVTPAHAKENHHSYDYMDGGIPHVPAVHESKVIVTHSEPSSVPVETWGEYWIYSSSITNVASMTFSDGSRTVGTLSWNGGKMRFKGKADGAAKSFFDNYLKKIIDEYMKSCQCSDKNKLTAGK